MRSFSFSSSLFNSHFLGNAGGGKDQNKYFIRTRDFKGYDIIKKKKERRKKDKNPPVTGHNNMEKGIHDLRDTRNLSFDLKEREEMKILSQATRNLIFASVEQRKTPVTRK